MVNSASAVKEQRPSLRSSGSLGPARPRHALLLRLVETRELGILFLLLLVVIGTTLVQPRFWGLATLRNVLLWIPLLAVVAMGQMMVIITRGIDVSVGSIVGVVGMAVGILFRDVPWFSIPLGVLCSLLFGLVFGSLNGALISWARIPAVIVTLGGMSAYRGLAFILAGPAGSQIDSNELPTELIRWSQVGPFGLWLIPWLVIITLGIAGLTYLFLRYTTTGRNIYALGSNPEAARMRGVPVERVTFVVYAFTGAMAGLAGLLYASRFGFVNPGQTGVGLELTVIASVVIGGVAVFGGSGSVVGVLLGCLLLGTINVALAVLGVPGTWKLAVYGFVIVFAVTLDALLHRQLRRAIGGG